MDKIKNKIYKGDLVAGSLLMEESRKIAHLLLQNTDADGWHQAIIIENLLQKRSPEAAKRQARLIKSRLILMDRALWTLVRDGLSEVASQALLAAAIKHNRLIGDFMDTILRQHWQTFTKNINVKDWNLYLDQCAQIDPKVDTWKTTTRSKLKQIVFRILAEAKYIDSTRTCQLIPVSIAREVKTYLVKNREDYVLSCMEIT
jgi:bacteriophage exclusion system BrxA-like protein